MSNVPLLKLSDYVSDQEDFHYVFYDRFNPKKTIEHSHDYYEIMLITENSFIQHVNGTAVMLQAGNICFIRPTDIHRFSEDKGKIGSFINLSFRSHLISSLFEFLEVEEFNALLEMPTPPIISVSPNKLSELKSQLFLLQSNEYHNIDLVNITAKVILVNIFSLFYSCKADELKGLPKWLRRAMYQMQEKKNFQRGVKRMQEIACVSPEHLSRVLRQHTGQTPGEYVNSIRINHTINLLSQTDMPIIDIALDVGFSSVSHFYKTFNKIHCCTPLQYRKKRMVKSPA